MKKQINRGFRMVKEYGYEYEKQIDRALLKKDYGLFSSENYNGAMCLRSGRDALRILSNNYKGLKVYLPALSCESMVSPFSNNNSIIFYKLNDDYSIDLKYLKSILVKEKAIFIYMDYFGNQMISSKSLQLIKNEYSDLIFVEDITHIYLFNKERKFVPNYTVASIRKWIDVPDGGLLWNNCNEKLNVTFSNDYSFFEKKLYAQDLRKKYLMNGNEKLKLEFRNIFSTVTDIIENDNNPCRMSKYSFDIISKTDFELIKKQRMKNAKVLIDILKSENIKLIQSSNEKSNIYVGLLINNRDEIQKELSSLGIFCTIIWPLSEKQKTICKVAKYTEECILAVPCDHRYSEKDMNFIGKEIVRIIHEKETFNIGC